MLRGEEGTRRHKKYLPHLLLHILSCSFPHFSVLGYIYKVNLRCVGTCVLRGIYNSADLMVKYGFWRAYLVVICRSPHYHLSSLSFFLFSSFFKLSRLLYGEGNAGEVV